MTFDPRAAARETVNQGKPNSGQRQKPTSPKVKVSAVDPKPVLWTWHPYIPAGQISILGGPGGAGKGLVATALASCVSTGRAWPTTSIPAPRGVVLWGETEDPLCEVLRPRLIAASADCDQIYYCKPDAFLDLDLAAMIRDEGLRLVIMSPMFFLPPRPERHQ